MSSPMATLPFMPVVTPQPATARHILLLIVGALLVTIIRYATRPDPLRNIPGPWLARWTSILLAYHARTGKRHLYVDALHKRYGPFVRITPTQVSCATPSAPSKIYSHGSSSLPKSAFYRAFYVPSSRTSSLFTSFFPSRQGTSQPSFFDPGTPNLFSTQDRGGHARKRRVLAHALSASVVKGYEGWVRRCLVGLVKRLDLKCVGGLGKGLAVGAETPGRAAGSGGNLNVANDHVSTDTTGTKMATNTSMNTRAGSIASATTDNHSSTTPFIDILAWLNYMTLDVISSLAFGRALGLLEGEGQLNEMDGADLDENLARDLQPEKSHALASQIHTDTPHPSKHSSELPGSRKSRTNSSSTVPIHTLIDYRGRTAAFLGLFPAWHAILHPLLHRYAKWVPDEFVRRGVSGSEALSSIARHCVRQRLLSNSPSPSSAGWTMNSNATAATPGSDPSTFSDSISSTSTTSTSVMDSESDGEFKQENVRGSLLDAHGASPPDLLDRIIGGMKRAKKGEAAGLKAREREKDGGDATMAEFWEGGESEDGEGITEEDVVTEAMLLLTAGSDTTANSAAAVLFHLLRVPRVLACLREELEEAVGPVADELVRYDQIQSLKYLQATIDEGLRMFATNAFGLPRVVPPGGRVCIGEMNFGEGTELSAPAYTMQHDPAIWGDPEVFRPERWLEGSGIDGYDAGGLSLARKVTGSDGRPRGAELKKYLFTFGMGPRACIGQNLAIMQVKLLLATLVLRYDMELRDEVMDSVEGFMHKPVAVWMRLKRRRGQGSRIVHD